MLTAVTIGSPRAFLGDFFLCATGFIRRENHLFHHLTDHAVGENVGGSTVFFAHGEGFVAAVAHFLGGIGREDKTAVCTVSSALDNLEVVALFRADVAETGTAAHDVDDDRGQFKRREVADSFLFQADSESGTSGHDAFAGGACADYHIDCADFRFRLKKGAVKHREKFCGGMGDFTRGGDRIAVECIASGKQSPVDDGFVSFEQQTVQICHVVTSISVFRNFKDCDCARFGTLIEAGSAADALIFDRLNKCVAHFVQMFSHGKNGTRTRQNTASASLALFGFHFDFITLHSKPP